jgi:photosystem II stability/assembly factor-like uncharacterized protein
MSISAHVGGSHALRVLSVLVLLACLCFAQEFTIQSSTTMEDLRGVSGLKTGIMWASGTHGTYLRSKDGGRSWEAGQVSGAETLDFRDVVATDPDTTFLLSAGPGEQSRIYRTTDAGKTWDLQFTNHEPRGFLDCMAFWNQQRGIVVGDPVDGHFVLIRTENGGKDWRPVAPQKLPPAVDGEGAFAASGTCITTQGQKNVWFATGGSVARVFHSQDGGDTWSVVQTPIAQGKNSSGIFSIAFRDARHGAIAGGDYKNPDGNGPNLAFTDDGGATWTLAPLSPQWYFSVLAWKPHSGGLLAAGTARAAYAKGQHSRTWQKTWPGAINSVSFYNMDNGVAVGPRGLIETINIRH